MSSVNVTTQTGRLVRDLEYSETAGGTPVVKGRLAVDEASNKKGENGRYQSGFFNIESYGAGAKAAAEKIGEGWLVAISGRLVHETWRDAQDNPRQAVKIVGDITFLAEPRNRDGGREQQQSTEAEAEAGKESDKGSKAGKSPEAKPARGRAAATAGAGAER